MPFFTTIEHFSILFLTTSQYFHHFSVPFTNCHFIFSDLPGAGRLPGCRQITRGPADLPGAGRFTGCRQIYRVPADLPGASRLPGCRQIYRVPADLPGCRQIYPGAGRSNGCQQIYRVLQMPNSSLFRFSSVPVSPEHRIAYLSRSRGLLTFPIHKFRSTFSSPSLLFTLITALLVRCRHRTSAHLMRYSRRVL